MESYTYYELNVLKSGNNWQPELFSRSQVHIPFLEIFRPGFFFFFFLIYGLVQIAINLWKPML